MDLTFAPVKGYEGNYEVSRLGEVRSIPTRKLLKPYLQGRYYRVKLYKDGFGKMYMLHRVVADAFCENPFQKPFVNHIDGNRLNNSADNLEWCTASENEAHAHRIGLNSVEPMLKKTRKRVAQIDSAGHLVKIWGSMSEAARAVGVDVSGISFCCSGRLKTSGGFRWSLEI